jgi:hypothetical protein
MNGLGAGSVRCPRGDLPLRRPRARSVGREGYLEQAFGRRRAAGGVEHVYESAERDRHLPVAGIIEKEPVREG